MVDAFGTSFPDEIIWNDFLWAVCLPFPINYRLVLHWTWSLFNDRLFISTGVFKFRITSKKLFF